MKNIAKSISILYLKALSFDINFFFLTKLFWVSSLSYFSLPVFSGKKLKVIMPLGDKRTCCWDISNYPDLPYEINYCCC